MIHGITPPPDWEDEHATTDAASSGQPEVQTDAPVVKTRLKGLLARAMAIKEKLRADTASAAADYDAEDGGEDDGSDGEDGAVSPVAAAAAAVPVT